MTYSVLSGTLSVYTSVFQPGFSRTEWFCECHAGVLPMASKKIKLRPKLPWDQVWQYWHCATCNNKVTWVTSNLCYLSGHTSLFLIWATITLIRLQCYIHTPVSIGVFSCKLWSTEKCCFCLFGIEQTLVSLHAFHEQSKCSRGFRSDKKIEKHCSTLLLLMWWLVADALLLLQAGAVFVAMYEYEAQDTDEVSFIEGDHIIDTEAIDDGWMYGKVERTGQVGMLPANYVELLAGNWRWWWWWWWVRLTKYQCLLLLPRLINASDRCCCQSS